MSCVISIGLSVLSFTLARNLRTALPFPPTPWLKCPDCRLDPSGCHADLYAGVVDLAPSRKSAQNKSQQDHDQRSSAFIARCANPALGRSRYWVPAFLLAPDPEMCRK